MYHGESCVSKNVARTDVHRETFGREEEEERTNKHSNYLRGETSVDGARPFRGNMVEWSAHQPVVTFTHGFAVLFFSELVSCFSLAPRLFPPVFFLVCQLVAAETFPKPLEYPWFFALFQAGSRGCIREFPCTRSFPFCFHRHSSIYWVRYRFNIFTTETG